MKRVIVIGASGHGRVVADIVKASGDEVVGFLDDDENMDVLGKVDDCLKYTDSDYIIAIGNAEIRERISRYNLHWYTAVHPAAVIAPSAVIGEGTAIMANAVINSGAQIGKHCIINTGAIVEHDNVIGDYAHISVGVKLGGTVRIGDKTWIGIGSSVSNNINICGGCMIGTGAVVVKNIDEAGTYVGVPAKRIK